MVTCVMQFRRILAAGFLAAFVAGAAGPAAAAPAFQAGLTAGALCGLDSLARGGQAGLDLALAFGRGSGQESGDAEGCASIGITAFASWDGSLASAFAGLGLRLGLGPSLSVTCYREFPLGDPRLSITEVSAVAHLSAAGWLNGLGLEARLARIAAGGGNRPSLYLTAGLSWSAFGVASMEPSGGSGTDGAAMDAAAFAAAFAEALAEALAGKAGFAAGFRARIMVELRWGGPSGAFQPARP